MATQSSKNPQSSRAEHAYQQLLNAIVSGELKPGSRIREVELAEWLKISRTPVREISTGTLAAASSFCPDRYRSWISIASST